MVSFDIILVSKLVCDFLWLKVFSNSANFLSWNQPCIQGIFLFWYRMGEKAYRLYFVLYQRGKMPWDDIVIKHIKLIQKRHFSKSMMFPHILGTSLVNLNQLPDSCRFISIKKRKFERKTIYCVERIFFIDIILLA